jgi:ATP-dependent Clp protease, protease subunit
MERTPDRIVTLWGDEITPYQTNSLRRTFEDLLAKDRDSWITFQIMSPGGRCDAGFALYDWLLVNVPKLQTVAYGGVNSMAVILYAAGSKRVVTKHASFYLHPVQSSYESKTTLDQEGHVSAIESLKVTQGQYLEVLSQKTKGQKRKKLEKLIRETTTITAGQALEMGLALEKV